MPFNSCDVCQACTCDDMGVDYSKKDVKVIKSVDKAQGKAVSRMVVSTCKMVVVSSPFTVFQSCSKRRALQESYFTNMQHLAPYFVELCFDHLSTVYVSPISILNVEFFVTCTVSLPTLPSPVVSCVKKNVSL